MMALFLFILAGITLAVTVWYYLKVPESNRTDRQIESVGKVSDTRKSNETLQQNFWRWLFQSPNERRRDYYRNVYLKSDAWKRKRYVVLRRDNWRCVYCGARATQVHHKKYARKNIGREPIEWLVSICKPCHEAQHR